MSAQNSFLSILSAVLLDSSHTTLKSMIPLLDLTSFKYGVTRDTNCDLVNESLNSNNENFAAVAIAFSKTMNSLRTLILSNALGFDRAVQSPKRIVPSPGVVITGLTPSG